MKNIQFLFKHTVVVSLNTTDVYYAELLYSKISSQRNNVAR